MNDLESEFSQHIIDESNEALAKEKCLWKAILEYRKLEYVNCAECPGYNSKCEYYQEKPKWFVEEKVMRK